MIELKDENNNLIDPTQIVNIGFTGTQHGMTAHQKDILTKILKMFPKNTNVYHGDCIGADEVFHDVANQLGLFTIIHPPIDSKKRAFCDGNIVWKPREYIIRNHRIVDSCSMLIATPQQHREIVRSGTWATVRYARNTKKPVVIIYPNP